MSPAVVLVGPPGAGKTTVGRALARRLGVGFRDTDADLEAVTGCTVAEVFARQGEPVFRSLEADAVAAALAGHDGVLSLGGGAVETPATRELLRDHAVVHLEVGLDEALARVAGPGPDRPPHVPAAADRPLLAGDPRARLTQLLDRRAPLYAEVATATVATDGRTPDEVAAEVVARVQHARAQGV